MWSQSYSKTVTGVDVDQLWKVWSDVNQWHTWQDDVESARLDGEFKPGSTFRFKPKGAPAVNIELIEVEQNKKFVDLTRFPMARMTGSHEFIVRGDELDIVTTMSISGPLAFLWRKLVAEDIVKSLPKQTESLLQRAAHG